jgi:hypothetical protein
MRSPAFYILLTIDTLSLWACYSSIHQYNLSGNFIDAGYAFVYATLALILTSFCILLVMDRYMERRGRRR